MALMTGAQYIESLRKLNTRVYMFGEKINRFCHIHQSTEDLINKVKMQRLLGQKTASCFQRCVGMDAFNAVYSTTYEIDEKYGTGYHERFKKFLIYVQNNDLTVDGAMTDPKGDRSKAPHQQEDPDLFVRIKEVRPDGIVVHGAGSPQAQRIMIQRQSDMEGKKSMAKKIIGIAEKPEE